MREEQIQALKDYVKALIDLKVGDALGRDTLHENIRLSDTEGVLDRVLSDFDDN